MSFVYRALIYCGRIAVGKIAVNLLLDFNKIFHTVLRGKEVKREWEANFQYRILTKEIISHFS